MLHSIGGVDWEDMVNSGKNVLGVEGADMVLLVVVGKKSMLEWGNIHDKVHMDNENAVFNTNGGVYSNVGDGSSKHELQMQLMAENMEGIMQIIAHRMDTSGKNGFLVDRKEVEKGDNICIVRGERRVVVAERER